MNNLLSYCGLVDARIRASEEYLPVSSFSLIDCQNIIYIYNSLNFFFSAIGDGEKVEIRRLMLQSFGSEPVYQIALQAAVSIGKIARYDVPKDWPELLPALVQAVQVVDPLIQQRALLVLHHVIKALASKR